MLRRYYHERKMASVVAQPKPLCLWHKAKIYFAMVAMWFLNFGM
jgi:hypothetical protein